MFMRVLFTLLLISIAPAAFSTSARAQDETPPIGNFVLTEGIVTVSRTGIDAPENAAAAMPVYLHDVIETGPEARAVVILSDESELILGENAQTSVDEYIYEPVASQHNKALISVLRGAFQYASGQIGKNKRPDVRVNIPYGSIGLRGTRLWGGFLESYGVFVLDGEVSVTTKRGTVRVQKGEGTDLKAANDRPGNVKTWGQAKIDRAVATVTLPEEAAALIAAEKERLLIARGGTPAPEATPEQTAPPEETVPDKKTENAPETTPEETPDTPPRPRSAFGDDDESQPVPKIPALDDGEEPTEIETTP